MKYLLGIEAAHSRQEIFIYQHKKNNIYIKEVACKPTSTPINFNHKLGEVEEDVVHVLYIFMLQTNIISKIHKCKYTIVM